MKKIAAATLLLLAVGLLVKGQPTLEERMERREAEWAPRLAAREVQIAPAELLDLMHNNQVRLKLVDVRGDAEFNLFHLVDAERVDLEALGAGWGRELHPETVVVLMDEDESEAVHAWKVLQANAVPNVYLLEGGVEGWVRAFQHTCDRPHSDILPVGGALPRAPDPVWRLAWGERHELSRPDPQHVRVGPYTPKVKVAKPAAAAGGGCG